MKKKLIVVISILLCAALLCGAGWYGYTLWRGSNLQKQLKQTTPQGYAVTADSGLPLEQVATQWLQALLQPYQLSYAPKEMQITTYIITNVQTEDMPGDNTLLLQFTFTAAQGQTDAFSNWDVSFDGTQYQAMWLIQFEEQPAQNEGQSTYTAVQFLRPALLDYQEYVQSGQKQQDEYNQQHVADIPFTPGLYPYKIQDKTCFVSYDAGQTWVPVPVDVQQIDHYVDGNPYYNSLQEGSYTVSPNKTALLYGGVTTPLGIVYSNNGGQSWQTSTVSSDIEYIEGKFVSFPTQSRGYVAVGYNKTMGWQQCAIFTTIDGGKTWAYVREGPGDRPILSFGFVSEDVGFISYSSPPPEGSAASKRFDMARTADGGVTWQSVELDIPQDLQPYFSMGMVPYKQGDTLVLLVGEDPMSDYSAKQDFYLQYTSADEGLTWQYQGPVQIPAYEPG